MLRERIWNRFIQVFCVITLVMAVVFFAIPIVWMIGGSLKPTAELIKESTKLLPTHPTFDGYRNLIMNTEFVRFLFNSIVIATVSAGIASVIGTMAGYSMNRFSGNLITGLSYVSLLGYMISPVALAIPFFIIWRFFGLTNSLLGVTLAHFSFTLPYAIWSMKGFFANLPIETEERALMEGYSPTSVVFRVVVPLAFPGVVTTFLFCFIISWNEYVFARILINRDQVKTAPIGIDDLFQGALVDWTKILTAGVLMLVPAILFVVAAQKQIRTGSMKLWQ